jgi:hypothetical protein
MISTLLEESGPVTRIPKDLLKQTKGYPDPLHARTVDVNQVAEFSGSVAISL